jgi:hypothetical protein
MWDFPFPLLVAADGDEGFAEVSPVVLPREVPDEVVQARNAAVERLPIVFSRQQLDPI